MFGLRGEEAVQSVQPLKTWQTAIANGNTKIKVIFGTKGGRPRETIIINREKARNAVNTAIQTAEQQNGKLINKPNLKEAMTYWRNHIRAIGLKGQLSPHSLRYAFANDAIDHYQQQGHSSQEIYALTSMHLGHGDGRGRYIKKANFYVILVYWMKFRLGQLKCLLDSTQTSSDKIRAIQRSTFSILSLRGIALLTSIQTKIKST